ncbi:UDP-glycosyltransferase 87A1-like [Pyrus ussuriensis x Pyrus communis]|uniref:UDP-glycosyltransferase 87A1-like n=1 Tax=Pyrus ussuriensis x Pyrus communis TaxID=2448454 RepID=A0A5N5FVI7_9ROSA|nr:UDP-glycosyltransferase 87A1-like [Pyrus ussuriensis x Pyrus communis]
MRLCKLFINKIVEYIPGVSTTSVADLPPAFLADHQNVVPKVLEAVSQAVEKAQYLLFTSVYELDPQVFEALKAKFAFPIYPIGPSVPHFELSKTLTTNQNDIDYLHWLDSQPKKSVLYISMGISKSQMDEIATEVKSSCVRVFWVARGDASKLRDCVGDLGLVVPWCDQLRVLCHDSIGGFWLHCGWNATLEAVYVGLPILTCPISWDQIPNGKQIVEDWRIGYQVKNVGVELLVSSKEIAELVKKFMDVESEEGKDLRERAEQLQEVCRGAIANGGSSDRNVDAFLKDISQGHN